MEDFINDFGLSDQIISYVFRYTQANGIADSKMNTVHTCDCK